MPILFWLKPNGVPVLVVGTVSETEAAPTLQSPLDEKAEAKALSCIQKYSNRPNGYMYDDFEQQVRDYSPKATPTLVGGTMHYPSRTLDTHDRMLVSYVIVEVVLRNLLVLSPPTTFSERIQDHWALWRNRLECMYFVRGVNPKPFADVHYDFINRALIVETNARHIVAVGRHQEPNRSLRYLRFLAYEAVMTVAFFLYWRHFMWLPSKREEIQDNPIYYILAAVMCCAVACVDKVVDINSVPKGIFSLPLSHLSFLSRLTLP